VSDRILIELGDDGVADVRLNRPEKMNALDSAMFEALADAGHQLAETPGLRAAVLSGEGRAFCAGLDFASFQATTEPGAKPTRNLLDRPDGTPANFAQSAAWVWRELPVPVVAAIHGVAYGGGLQIALGADIRIVAPDLRLSIMEIKWGLIPDVGITQTLRDLVSLDVAKELTFTGRILDGEQAKALGLVSHVAEDPHAQAMDLAREIASKSPDAIRSAKQLFEETWHADERTGLELETKLQLELIGSENQVEAIRANFDKRAPDFKNAR